MADENEEVRIKDLTELKYKGFLPLDDEESTGKFPIDNLFESIAPVFDATVDYAEGQSVMYQGKLYTFKVNHPAGAWNARHVDVTNTQNVYAEKNSVVYKEIGENLCDPTKLTAGFYNGLGFYSSNGYRTSDYIPVDGKNLTAKFVLVSTVISSITVFNSSKQYLRSIKQNAHYEYIAGDYYVRVTWDADWGDVNYISYGEVATTEEYSPIGGYVEKRYVKVGSITLDDVQNGTEEVMQTQADLPTRSVKTVISDNEFTITNNGVGSWIGTPDLPFDGSKYHVSFIAENLTAETYPNSECTIFVANGTDTASSGQYATLGSFKDGTFDFVFEPQYYAAHMGWTKIRVWLRWDNGNGTDDKVWDFKNWKIYKINDELQTSNISGRDAKALFGSVDDQITELKGSVEQFGIELVGSDGKKYAMSVASGGSIVAIPIIPTKAHFFGNSLLNSNGSAEGTYGNFGMNATDHNLDYASRFEECVLTLNPSYTYERDANSGFEDLTTSDPVTVLPLIQEKYLDKLDGDEDFICVQLGDNGLASAVAVLGANVETLLRAIRNKCEGARVFVFGMWYSSTEKQTALYNAASNTGCKYINMNGIRSAVTESFYGAVINEGYTGTWSVSDVVSVTENSSGNITVVFTADGENRTSTIDVDSYTLNGTNLTYTGSQKITVNGGVASHPGNEGFRLLANRLLYETKIVNDEEYFEP